MDYLLTGASGFIGRRLVTSLLADGHTVKYLARQRKENLDGRASFFFWEPGEEPPLDCMGRLDAIIHLAGETVAQRWTAETKRRIAESRVERTRKLVSAMGRLREKPGVLVSASAIGYYGGRGEEILTEGSAPADGFLANLCVHWEREAEKAREFGVRVVPVRFAVVLGREGGALKSMLPLFRAGLGGRLASGRQWMSWICADDVVRLLRFTAEQRSVTGVMNGTSPEPVRNVDFTRLLAKAVHRPAFLPVPRMALRLAMGEVADHLVDSSRVLPEAALRHGFEFECPSLDVCLRKLV